MHIDINSATWKAVLRFIESETQEAVEMLVADKESDQQRGIIHVLDRLSHLPNDPIEKVVADSYS